MELDYGHSETLRCTSPLGLTDFAITTAPYSCRKDMFEKEHLFGDCLKTQLI